MKRITISVSDEIAAKAQRAVNAGYADSVSAYFGALARQEPDWVTAHEVICGMIQDAGGITEADNEWALRSLGLIEPGDEVPEGLKVPTHLLAPLEVSP